MFKELIALVLYSQNACFLHANVGAVVFREDDS